MRHTLDGSSVDAKLDQPARPKPGGARVVWFAALGILSLGLLGRQFSGEWLGARSATNSTELAAAARAGTLPGDDELRAFSARITGDLEQMWLRDFSRRGQPFEAVRSQLFGAPVEAACNGRQRVAGPSFCEEDQTVYVDLAFHRQLRAQHGSAGDAAQAYVIAHEFGHLVQSRLGFTAEVKNVLQRRPAQSHAVGVRLELQADCFAGIWARTTSHPTLMDRQHVEDALRSAAELGREQRKARVADAHAEHFGYAVPRQRMFWFAKGFGSGRIQDCDTFAED